MLLGLQEREERLDAKEKRLDARGKKIVEVSKSRRER